MQETNETDTATRTTMKLYLPRYQGGGHHVKLRQLLYIGSCAIGVMFLLLGYKMLLSDPCDGRKYTEYLCAAYRDQVIGGTLCKSLCDNGQVQLNKCLGVNRQYMEFAYQPLGVVRINTEYMHASAYSHFSNPPLGMTTAEFHEMVSQFVENKMGSKNEEIVKNLMTMADVNYDTKVSLAEAKTVWSLLNDTEFFFTFLLQKTGAVPTLQGFCGDSYITERFPHMYLYKRDSKGMVAWAFPKSYRWRMPSWENRAKVIVGLFEFIQDVYQHATAGTVYMCGLSEHMVGYTKTFDAKMTDLSNFVTKTELQAYLSDRTCQSELDCVYSTSCMATCDKSTHQCTGELMYPNLVHACKIVLEYLLPDIPATFPADDLKNLVARCLVIQGHMQNAEVEHSLVLNDIKSILWKYISHKTHS